MKQTIDRVEINGEFYRREGADANQPANLLNGLPCVLIRTFSAGVHFGYLKRRDGKEVELVNSRRVYYWSGACSLSQMAVDGVAKPNDCKFSVVVASIVLTEAIEILSLSAKAQANLFAVPEWKS